MNGWVIAILVVVSVALGAAAVLGGVLVIGLRAVKREAQEEAAALQRLDEEATAAFQANRAAARAERKAEYDRMQRFLHPGQ